MTHVLACLAAAAMGVEGGWQPREGGGMEYIVQIEPEVLDSLREGGEIRSTIPSFLKDVRGYRVRVSRGEVPRVDAAPARPGEPTPANPKTSAAKPAAKPAGGTPGEPTLASPTFRGQNPGDDDAASSSRRFSDRYSDSPDKLEPIPAAEPMDDFAADSFSTKKDPFAVKRDNRVAQTDYRDDDLPASRGTAGKSTTTTKPRSNSTSSKPTRASFDDEPEARSTTAKPTKTGTTSRTTTSRTSGTATKSASKDEDAVVAEEKPWFAFTMLALALFASLGGNWYLGWMNWDLRNKYQRALNDRKWRREDYEPSARVA